MQKMQKQDGEYIIHETVLFRGVCKHCGKYFESPGLARSGWPGVYYIIFCDCCKIGDWFGESYPQVELRRDTLRIWVHRYHLEEGIKKGDRFYDFFLTLPNKHVYYGVDR